MAARPFEIEVRQCFNCGEDYEPIEENQETCSAACWQKWTGYDPGQEKIDAGKRV